MKNAISLTERLPRVEVRSRSEWRAWLEANHLRVATSVWVVTYKKGNGRPHVPYGEIVEEALCFGWIDSRPARLDADRSMLLLSPRRAGSAWSKPNKERASRAIVAGLMAAAGLAKIEAAKADGSWNALDAVEALEVPDDLRAALDGDPTAVRGWAGYPPSTRRGLLDRIRTAKLPATRAKRIAETVRRAAESAS